MFKGFIAALVVYALIVSWRAPGWTLRTVALVLTGLMGLITAAGVLFSLMAP